MKLLIIISSFIIAQAAVLEDDSNAIKINGICYEKEVLRANMTRPRQLRVDSPSNILYFSYYDNDNSIDRTAKYDLNTNELTLIEGIHGLAQAIDPKTHDVYLGGNDGIYKYNKDTNKAEFLGEKGKAIWGMFYKDTLYFTLFSAERIYSFANGQATILEDLKDTWTHYFLIDNEDYMFYSNDTGVYGQKKGTKDAVLYKKLQDEVGRQFSTDVNGKVYVCLDSGIYVVNKETKTLDNVFNRKDSIGIAFDNDNNIIYSDLSNLFRLKANRDLSC